MKQTIGYGELTNMLLAAVTQIRGNHELLSKLDSFGGDGDHGTTMLRGMGILEETIKESSSRSIHTLLSDIGWAVMGVDGGATGPLFGSLFGGMSEPAEGKNSIDTATLAEMFESGLASVKTLTKAKPGNKTMIDALVPAVAALRKAADDGLSVTDALAAAAAAAQKGADDTKQMQAAFGRAKTLGKKSIGNADPGATSVSLIFKGFIEGVK
jgi:dihydroxyacetone kinase-like protein